MKHPFRPAFALLASLSAASIVAGALPVAAQTATPPESAAVPDTRFASPVDRPAGSFQTAGPGYADMADLVLAAPVIADVTIRSTTRIKGAEAATVAPGQMRLYVEADVTTLIRGAQGVPPRIGYLLDITPDPGGRVPRFKKARVLVFARTVPGAGDQLQLIGPDAQLDWSPAADARVKAIAHDALAADAPPRITDIRNAFHVPGALPGEGETQVFLATADGRPVSLSVLRRPGEQPRWAVALSEIVDDSAAPPARDTLLWYRLACSLPATLPDHSTEGLEPADAASAREDYRFVIESLGRCGRSGRRAG